MVTLLRLRMFGCIHSLLLDQCCTLLLNSHRLLRTAADAPPFKTQALRMYTATSYQLTPCAVETLFWCPSAPLGIQKPSMRPGP